MIFAFAIRGEKLGITTGSLFHHRDCLMRDVMESKRKFWVDIVNLQHIRGLTHALLRILQFAFLCYKDGRWRRSTGTQNSEDFNRDNRMQLWATALCRRWQALLYLVYYFDENFEGYLKKPNKRKEDAFIEIIKNSNILLHVHSFGVRLIEWSNGVGLENIQTLGLWHDPKSKFSWEKALHSWNFVFDSLSLDVMF